MDMPSAQDRINWAIEKLGQFISASDTRYISTPSGTIGFHRYETVAKDATVVEQWVVVERILAQYLPDWQDRVRPLNKDMHSRGYHWQRQREAAQYCKTTLEAREEVGRFLVDVGPNYNAASLHPWVWDAAKSAWEAGNFEDAVDAAARNVNGRLRAKVGRKDLGEGDLIAQVFSDRPADQNSPRLRLPLSEGLGDRTATNIHGGIIAYGKGLYQSVRNPLAHEAPTDTEMEEREAFECLAAFSLLARWIDRSSVHRS